MVRLVLFDIDGTLIRTGGAGLQAFERAFALEFRIPKATERVHFAGRTDSSLVREVFERHGIESSRANFRRFIDSYVFWLDHLLNQLEGTICPGVDAFIGSLKRLPLPPVFGLLTGNLRLGAEIKLRHYQLWDLFQTGAFGDDHELRDELAVIACKRGSELLGEPLEGAQILVIGDTPRDIECARAINARSLAVATGGYSVRELEKHQPDWAVQNLAEVAAGEVVWRVERGA